MKYFYVAGNGDGNRNVNHYKTFCLNGISHWSGYFYDYCHDIVIDFSEGNGDKDGYFPGIYSCHGDFISSLVPEGTPGIISRS